MNGTEDAEDADATLKAYSIDSGDVNISRDPSSLGNQQYAPGSNDVVAMTARIVVDQPLLVDGIKLTATSSIATLVDVNKAFNNFRLFLNDNLVDSENTIGGSDADYSIEYDTTFEIA